MMLYKKAREGSKTLKYTCSLCPDEVLHVLEPIQVLLLLLVLNIVGNKESKRGVNASLVEVPLQKVLDVAIEIRELWAGVHSVPLPVGLGSLSGGQRSVLMVKDIFNDDQAFLSYSLDLEGTLVGLIPL
jgi:hypothetical protein